ncbi:MAG: UDP-glucose/GDP-mannose dehydrogenase family protein [Proteobacteria bacterium]|nr:UDP-glucose/GDP-mannose dehydrogenase family protein [Pseudomonadota bacterium]MBU1742145.1 UDP-glucose/GDP-mannose dehydrogenase family protein [Pseudomonadota bacterium]
MNICVVGTGYVGLVTGTCFAEFGLNVACVDKDRSKIEALENGRIPIYEPGLGELAAKNVKEGRLRFSTDIPETLRGSLVVFIAVGTPQDQDGSANLEYVLEVAAEVGRNLNGYKVIVTKSTVPVGTGRRVEEIIARESGGSTKFDIASNPEFLREGSAIEDFLRPNRVVIGADTEQAVAILRDLYRPLYLIETPFVVTTVETAELVKYASNAFLATKISFINEMANLCELVGADVHAVAKGMGLDQRIGPKFLHPGPGYGGSCFPKDTVALCRAARDAGYEFKIVEAVCEVNRVQRRRMTDKIVRIAGPVEGQRIGFLGLTFKPNTDDMRDSPAVDIIRDLQNSGARVQAFDPAGMDEAREVLPEVTYCADAYEAAAGADAVVLITEWNQFRNLDLERVKSLMRGRVFVDLRNVYEPERMRRLGFTYEGVGRGAGGSPEK